MGFGLRITGLRSSPKRSHQESSNDSFFVFSENLRKGSLWEEMLYYCGTGRTSLLGFVLRKGSLVRLETTPNKILLGLLPSTNLSLHSTYWVTKYFDLICLPSFTDFFVILYTSQTEDPSNSSAGVNRQHLRTTGRPVTKVPRVRKVPEPYCSVWRSKARWPPPGT